MIELPRNKPRWLLFSIVFRLRRPFVRTIGLRRFLRIILDLDKALVFLANNLSAELGKNGIPDTRANEINHIISRFPHHSLILDLGCGDGTDGILLSRLGFNVIGVDQSRESINRAQAKDSSDCQFICSDINTFLADHCSLALDSSAIVFMSHVLEHISSPLALLSLLSASFAYIYIEVPDFNSCPLNRTRLLVGSRLYSDDDHVWEFDREGLVALAVKAGWQCEHCEIHDGVISYYGRPLPESLSTA